MTAETPEPQPPESTVSETIEINLISDISAVKAMAKIPPPEILYHYTTRQPLLDIVTTRTLYASNIRYLNDSQELELATDFMKEIIAAIDLPQHELNNDFKDWALRVSHIVTEVHDTFVASFSAKGDDLSQWRAYSGRTDGYAIGFTSSDLVPVVKPQKCFLFKCIYEEHEQRALLRSVLIDAHDRLIALTNQGKPLQDALHVAVTMFAGGFFIIAPIIKHSKFSDEKEWRVIDAVNRAWGEHLSFRNSGTMLVPYKRITWRDKPPPIAAVVVGPHPHMKLEKRALKGFLTVNDLPDVTITESEIPYRNW